MARIIQLKSLRRENAILRQRLSRRHKVPEAIPVPYGASLEEMERVVIAATLQRTRGNIREAAAILGINRSTLYEKIKKYRIPRSEGAR